MAIKIILPQFANQSRLHPALRRPKRRSSRAWNTRTSCRLYDYWRDPDGAYLVMRCLRGGSLSDALRNSPFDSEAAALLLDQIASGAGPRPPQRRDPPRHQTRQHPAGRGRQRLSGRFRHRQRPRKTEDDRTGGHVIVGSLDYISPEQARSEPVTPADRHLQSGRDALRDADRSAPLPQPFVGRAHVQAHQRSAAASSILPTDMCDCDQRHHPDSHRQRPRPALSATCWRWRPPFRESSGRGDNVARGDKVVEQLTLREHEVLQLITDGMSNQEIATNCSSPSPQ